MIRGLYNQRMLASIVAASLLLQVNPKAPLVKLIGASQMVGPFMEGNELVQYWEVEKALPDGKPDRTAPENFWNEARTTFDLVADSDTEPADTRGNRFVYIPRTAKAFTPEYWESAPASQKLEPKFKHVNSWSVGGLSSMTSAGMVQMVNKGLRLIEYRGHVIRTAHEIRTLGKERVERRTNENFYTYCMTVMQQGQRLDPFTQTTVKDEAKR